MNTSILDDLVKAREQQEPEADERHPVEQEVPANGLYLWLRFPRVINEAHPD